MRANRRARPSGSTSARVRRRIAQASQPSKTALVHPSELAGEDMTAIDNAPPLAHGILMPPTVQEPPDAASASAPSPLRTRDAGGLLVVEGDILDVAEYIDLAVRQRIPQTPTVVQKPSSAGLSASWDQETENGNTLLALVTHTGTTITDVPDGWQGLAGYTPAGIFPRTLAYIIKNAAPRSGAETFGTTGGGQVVVTLLEISGLDIDPQDKFASATGTSTTVSSGVTGAVEQNEEFLIAVLANAQDATQAAPTNGFALAKDTPSGAGAGHVRQGVYTKTITTGGTASTAATLSVSKAWSGLMLTLKTNVGIPTRPPAGKFRLYATEDGILTSQDDLGQEMPLVPPVLIGYSQKLAANWAGANNNNSQDLGGTNYYPVTFTKLRQESRLLFRIAFTHVPQGGASHYVGRAGIRLGVLGFGGVLYEGPTFGGNTNGDRKNASGTALQVAGGMAAQQWTGYLSTRRLSGDRVLQQYANEDFAEIEVWEIP